jgi:hypothetical protein
MKDMETQRSLCSTIKSIHKGYYPKQITGRFETAQSSSWWIYSHPQRGNT